MVSHKKIFGLIILLVHNKFNLLIGVQDTNKKISVTNDNDTISKNMVLNERNQNSPM